MEMEDIGFTMKEHLKDTVHTTKGSANERVKFLKLNGITAKVRRSENKYGMRWFVERENKRKDAS